MNINRTAAAVVIAIIMSGCTTVPRKDVEPLWLTAVKADYAANGKLSIAIETNRQYFVRGQKISLNEMCFIREKGMFPEDTAVVLVTRPHVTHADVMPALTVMKGQYWKIKVREAPLNNAPEANPPRGSPQR